MKILFNCTTNIVGGGTKNSAIFIKYAMQDKHNTYYYAISPQVKEILDKWGIDSKNIFLFKYSPAKNHKERDKLSKLANKLNVDTIFTMAGPAYTIFRQTHVVGISNPYITHADLEGFSIGKTFTEMIKTFLLTVYQAYYARKADFWIFQTNESRQGFIGRYFINKSKTAVIPNAIGNEFLKHYQEKKIHYCDIAKTVQIFCPAAGYYHKALQLIPKIAKELLEISNNSYQFEFVLTLQPDSDIWKEILVDSRGLFVEKNIKNIGSYNYTEVLDLFDQADIVFVPSILETFSASYLEAFASKRALVVADKGFAKDICGDAALYVDPFESKKTAEKIHALINDKKSQKKLITNGLSVLERYGDQEVRINSIIDYLKSVT